MYSLFTKFHVSVTHLEIFSINTKLLQVNSRTFRAVCVFHVGKFVDTGAHIETKCHFRSIHDSDQRSSFGDGLERDGKRGLRNPGSKRHRKTMIECIKCLLLEIFFFFPKKITLRSRFALLNCFIPKFCSRVFLLKGKKKIL